jgi:thiamine biosynthesis lipoprotein
MTQLTFRAMGCTILVIADSTAPGVYTELTRLPSVFESWERHLSRFLPESELMRLNAADGRVFPASRILREVLRAGLRAAEITGGLVTPMLLQLVAAGYDRSFENLGSVAERSATGVMPRSPSRSAGLAVQIDDRLGTVRVRPGIGLDLGGVAKGWAAARTADLLAAYGPALVDAGGDIAVSGPRADGRGWPIGIADPQQPGRELALIELPSGGVATSGRDYRRWRVNGNERHHIIDPRTGQPAQTDLLSVTVIGRSALDAEIAAKAVLIQGSRAGVEWLEARSELAGLLVHEDGTLILSTRMPQYLWSMEN